LLVAGLFWEKSTAGWWLISRTNRLSLYALLSITNSLGMSHSLRSLLTESSQVSLGRPLPLLTLPTRSSTPLRTGTLGGLLWTWPNHLNRCWTDFSSIGATQLYHEKVNRKKKMENDREKRKKWKWKGIIDISFSCPSYKVRRSCFALFILEC
jgi:hypothetical protein